MRNVSNYNLRLFQDFFNTIIGQKYMFSFFFLFKHSANFDKHFCFIKFKDLRWRWHITIYTLSFFVSWLLFASLWYLISYFHGDLSVDANSTLMLEMLNTNLTNVSNNSHLIDTVLENKDTLSIDATPKKTCGKKPILRLK